MAARNERRDIVAYLCEGCGVPVHAIPAEEGTWQILNLSPVESSTFGNQTTPLLGAILSSRQDKDLALHLLTQSGQILLGQETEQGLSPPTMDPLHCL